MLTAENTAAAAAAVDPFSNRSFTTSATGRVQMPLAWKDLTYTVDIPKKGKRSILNGLTGVAIPGRTLAVMGGSGAGKTTFLNALADRLQEDSTHIVSGHTQIADCHDLAHMRKLLAFVTQDDIISEMSTPYESLYFSIRIRRGVTPEVAHRKTLETLEELGLMGCKDTIVGTPGLVKGLSGGERKRTNIGVELISNPKVLLLDEPTSGLDSVTAEKIIASLHDLAQRGRTIVFTIHQPNAETAANFDDLLLLVEGNIVYHGPYKQSLTYFNSIGYVCPSTYTPTDYYMTILQDATHHEKLITSWKAYRQTIPDDPRFNPVPSVAHIAESEVREEIEDTILHAGSSWGIQAVELFKRSNSNVKRNSMYVISILVQTLFFGLLTGLIFINIKDTTEGVQDRQGALFMVIINKAFSGVMGVIHTFPREKAVYVREQQAGAYSPMLYFLAKMVAELPTQIGSMVIEAIVVYFMVGFHRSATSFFTYFACINLALQVGIGLGLAISASIDDYAISAGMAPMLVLPMMLTGGLLASAARIKPYWKWLEKISLIKYAYNILGNQEFEHLTHISCNRAKLGDQCDSAATNGKEALATMGLSGTEEQPWISWICLSVMFVLARLLAIGALYRIAAQRGKH